MIEYLHDRDTSSPLININESLHTVRHRQLQRPGDTRGDPGYPIQAIHLRTTVEYSISIACDQPRCGVLRSEDEKKTIDGNGSSAEIDRREPIRAGQRIDRGYAPFRATSRAIYAYSAYDVSTSRRNIERKAIVRQRGVSARSRLSRSNRETAERSFAP